MNNNQSHFSTSTHGPYIVSSLLQITDNKRRIIPSTNEIDLIKISLLEKIPRHRLQRVLVLARLQAATFTFQSRLERHQSYGQYEHGCGMMTVCPAFAKTWPVSRARHAACTLCSSRFPSQMFECSGEKSRTAKCEGRWR